MTMNKLLFSLVGLLGHVKELGTLCACLDWPMHPEEQTKEIVKSMKGGGAFVTGKFDQYHSGEPLSAITQAFGELC
eukprot:11923691-Ditylum_brightwellii.AAC.1